MATARTALGVVVGSGGLFAVGGAANSGLSYQLPSAACEVLYWEGGTAGRRPTG